MSQIHAQKTLRRELRDAKKRVKLIDMRKESHSPGTALKSLREMASLTLKEVAAGADTSISYLSKVENGVLQPTPTYVARVVTHIAASILSANAT
ncbi:helix-turn-helix domain-containing protein [Leucobacter japonicus]|uniref:helix-turn-helix domain-containing protein n=1 Tax=Leucobacter japonicus TaxID=1461259 RepID=UPI0012E1DC35|nr:helix-turn-helix transcriptional regulator [Leucobacter japonicus]